MPGGSHLLINMRIIFKNTKIGIIIISTLLAVLLAAFNQFLLIGIVLIGILILICIYPWYINLWQSNLHNYLIAMIIIGFLSVTSDLGETIRMAVNLLNILTLFYIFIKQYGLELSKYPKLPGWMMNFILLVIFSMLLSTLFSANLSIGSIETSRQILFFVVIYIMYAFIESEKSVYFYIYSIIIAGGILSIAIVYSFISSDKLIYLLSTTGLVTDAGYFNNQAAAGGILAVAIPLTLTLIVFQDIRFIQNKKKLMTLMVIEFVALLLTNSRAAISACIISTMFITFILNRMIFKKIIFRTILLFFSLFFVFPNLIDAFLTFFRVGRVFENTRYILWEIAFSMYKDHPIFGVGPGLFRDYMYKYLPIMLGSWEERHQIRLLYNESSGVGLAHNFFISKISDLGILGLLTSILLPTLFFSTCIKLIKRMKNEKSNAYPIIVGICGIGLGLFYRSFFEVTGLLSYGWITRDLPFWLMFSILLFYFKNSRESVSTIVK